MRLKYAGNELIVVWDLSNIISISHIREKML